MARVVSDELYDRTVSGVRLAFLVVVTLGVAGALWLVGRRNDEECSQ